MRRVKGGCTIVCGFENGIGIGLGVAFVAFDLAGMRF